MVKRIKCRAALWLLVMLYTTGVIVLSYNDMWLIDVHSGRISHRLRIGPFGISERITPTEFSDIVLAGTEPRQPRWEPFNQKSLVINAYPNYRYGPVPSALRGFVLRYRQNGVPGGLARRDAMHLVQLMRRGAIEELVHTALEMNEQRKPEP